MASNPQSQQQTSMTSRRLDPQSAKPQTILEYLSQAMTTDELNELYKDKFTTLTLFRTLPTLAKQYLIRLTLLSPLTPVPRSLIMSWHYSSITKQDSLINKDALHCMVALKLLVKYNLPTPPPIQIPTASLIRSQNELHFYLNPYFHSSLRSALASTNPLQLHLSTLILPKYQQNKPPSTQNSTNIDQSTSKTSGDNNQGDKANGVDAICGNSTTTAVTKLKFKKRETQISTDIPTTTPASEPTPLTDQSLVSLTGNGAAGPERSKFQRQKRNIHVHSDFIRFELPIPPIYNGTITSTSSNTPTSNVSNNMNKVSPGLQNMTKTLPVLDVSFLDTFSLDQINSISLYIYNLLPSSYPSLVYPALPPTGEESITMVDQSNEAKKAAIPVLTGLSTFLIDLLSQNNIITFAGWGALKEPVVTKDGLNYTLKQPQDRAWALLLMYFDSIRAHNTNKVTTNTNIINQDTNATDPAAITTNTPKNTNNTSTNKNNDTSSPTTETPKSSLVIPSLGAVFQFLFHLSFAPLGTALPSFDLTTDQLHVLFHLSEFGLLYPLYSTQVDEEFLGLKNGKALNSSSNNSNDVAKIESTVSSSTQKPTPLTHGLLGFYPTRLLTNLSSSLKGTTFISASLKQKNGQNGISSEQIEETDDTLEALNLSSMTSYASAPSSSDGTSPAGNSGSSNGNSITEKAYAALIKDLSTPYGTLTNPSKRFIIVETTLKVYAFTNNPLDIRIMSYFIEFNVKLPNLCVGFITRKSVQNAITNGISNDAIVEWLTNHAHERMIRNAMGEFDTTLNKYKNNRDIILPINVVNQINIWATEQERFECFDAVIVEGFPTIELFKLWESCAKAEELNQKLLSLHPTQRPKPSEYRTFGWDGVHLNPPVVLFKNPTPGKSRLILHRNYFPQVKERFIKHQASAGGK